MGLYSEGLIIGMKIASVIWREGLFLGGLIEGLLSEFYGVFFHFLSVNISSEYNPFARKRILNLPCCILRGK